MAREKFQTLTEQMFYVLLTLREECCGIDVMARIANLTQGRVTVGPGTLYNLLDSFQAAGWIMETKTEGRKRSYLITPAGEQALADEYQRLQKAGEVPEGFMCSPGVAGVAKFYLLQLFNADLFHSDGMCVFQLPTKYSVITLATERLVQRMHDHNLAVHFWTINDPEDMRLLIEIGADGTMTDYPHRRKAVYDSFNG